MKRCFELAKKGFRNTNKNPMVGAVMVHNDRIIGEGYHENFGQAHAEVNCYNSIPNQFQTYIKDSTLYISLEPCSFHGKTPACTNLIISNPPKKVVISIEDPNPKVAGSGIKILQENNIETIVGICSGEGEKLIRKFKINTFEKRPLIALKWAQSKYFYAGKIDKSVWFTGPESRFLAHNLRAKFEAILIGSNTVILDNPSLDNRMGKGKSPIKVLIDRKEKVSKSSKIFHKGEDVLIFTSNKDYESPSKLCKIIYLTEEKFTWKNIFSKLFTYGISSVLVEGGPTIQKSILKDRLWDEAHVLSSNAPLKEGIKAPGTSGLLQSSVYLGMDHYQYIWRED